MKLIKRLIKKAIKIVRIILIKLNSRLRGDKLPYYCPCCNTHLKQFTYGEFLTSPAIYDSQRYRGIDQNVLCPVCESLPRHRILASWMNENTDRLSGKKILHFAQEKSLRKWFANHRIDCLTADLYKRADLQINIEETGLEDASFDVVICNHVLEHAQDHKKALKELHRIIRQKGMIIVSFPTDLSLPTVYEDASILKASERVLHFGQYDHLRVFGSDSKELLRAFGFDVLEISGDSDICDEKIKPVIGPADYDYNVLWCLTKAEQGTPM